MRETTRGPLFAMPLLAQVAVEGNPNELVREIMDAIAVTNIPVTNIAEAELDMPRLVELDVRGFTAVVAAIIIWLQQDHWVFKNPRRSIDLDQQEFAPRYHDPL